jgi:hypothetical protein
MSTVDLDVLARVPELIDEVQRLKAQVSELERQLSASKQPAADELISVDDAVSISGRQRDALYKLIRRGRLKAQRQGRALFVRRSDAQALVERRRGTR